MNKTLSLFVRHALADLIHKEPKMINDQTLQRIEKLHQMKLDGIITEAEFEQSKEQLLRGSTKRTSHQGGSPVEQAFPSADELITSIKLPLQRYADFNGRSRRKEFWLFQLIYIPITLTVVLFAGMGASSLATLVLAATILGLFIPQLALQVRRFHDQGKSGWFALFNLIPYIGIFIVLIFMLVEGTEGENEYGPDPKLSAS
jgi:uncharacterized membrane protein YhaH (DUF805 family)